jgi:hypothetical protein
MCGLPRRRRRRRCGRSARLSETFKRKREGSKDPSVVKTVEFYPVEIRAVGPS